MTTQMRRLAAIELKIAIFIHFASLLLWMGKGMLKEQGGNTGSVESLRSVAVGLCLMMGEMLRGSCNFAAATE
jgi:hypothetical protein